jgi:hypothetical protein
MRLTVKQLKKAAQEIEAVAAETRKAVAAGSAKGFMTHRAMVTALPDYDSPIWARGRDGVKLSLYCYDEFYSSGR